MNWTDDRISSMPNDVLTHILSFVSTKEAVQTCILSKRWRNVWASVPVLKFFSKEFRVDDSDSDDEIDEGWKFNSFVNDVLKNRGQSRVDTLIYDGDFESSSCHPSLEWLDRAAFLKPQDIKISIVGFNCWNAPDSLFSFASLQNLELCIRNDETIIGRPKSIALPSLKTMKLDSLDLDNDFAQNLFLGCPSLESLNLVDCYLDISEISSNVLKELTLYECSQSEHMQISCPGLVSFSIMSSINSIRVISLVNMASIVNANIDLCGDDEEVEVDDLPDLSILCGLSNATSLDLCLCDYQEQWEEDILKCRIFKNLKSLKIKFWEITFAFNLVAWFLEHSPVLQELTFDARCYIDITDAQEEPRQQVFFRIEYLETVKICCEKNDKLASKLISLLGRHVKTIGNVIIN